MPDMYIRAYDVGADGKLSNMRKLISFPARAPDVPDGLKVDSAGNIWATGPGGVRIISPKGKVLGQIVVPETVANVGFAEDGKTVYLTGSTSLYRLHIQDRGRDPDVLPQVGPAPAVDPLSRLIPKLNARLMPTLLMMYMLAFLDRSNVGFAKAGLQADAGIGYAAFAFGASIFFVGYALLEVPSNLILHRVGARRWLARIMITWGVVSAAQAFVQGPTSFYAVRFLLGVAEAGFFPA